MFQKKLKYFMFAHIAETLITSIKINHSHFQNKTIIITDKRCFIVTITSKKNKKNKIN